MQKNKREKAMKKYRSFNVEVVNNGFIVTIGCQKLVFKELDALAIELKNYWDDPEGVEKHYMENSIVVSSVQSGSSGTIRLTGNFVPGQGASVHD